MRTAPLLSQGVGSSIVPLLLLLGMGMCWAKLPEGELPGRWEVLRAVMAKQRCYV